MKPLDFVLLLILLYSLMEFYLVVFSTPRQDKLCDNKRYCQDLRQRFLWVVVPLCLLVWRIFG